MTHRHQPTPTVSVILPVYNARHFVECAVRSILEQSHTDLELIIINDGSTDGTSDILNQHASADNRIVLIDRENRGLVASLNEGVQLARGEFIARMDADDISLPSRIERQVAFLKSTGYDICGTSMQCFGNSRHIWRYPRTPEEVEVHLLFDSPYAHPSVMFRSVALKSLPYRTEFASAEDYDLWQRCWQMGLKGCNLDEILLKYRVHSKQISNQQKERQRLLACNIKLRHWQALFGENYESEVEELTRIFLEFEGDLGRASRLLKGGLCKYKGDVQIQFATQVYRLACRTATSTRKPWIVWYGMLKDSGLRRNRKQELVLLAIWLLRLRPESSFYAWLRKWYLGKQWQ